MNAQLATQLQDWKAQEFQRAVARYAAQNHDPSAPENRIRLGKRLEQQPAMGAPWRHRPNNLSWNFYLRAMGVPGLTLNPDQVDTRLAR